jgi:formamidopyrimidine-DNA glycosylase
MPELAEAEFFRKRWHLAGRGQRITGVLAHERARVFRGTDVAMLIQHLPGARFLDSEARAKQMIFRLGPRAWLGVHLGMSGELRAERSGYAPRKHDHLVLLTRRHALVFADPRMFGRVLFHLGDEPPDWWTKIAPAITSDEFTVDGVAAFVRRRSGAPIKAVLLMQERFPGIGNWMADEILWRAAIHPARRAGSLSEGETKTLWHECQKVCALALATIAGKGDDLPANLNVHIPRSWLFWHRWEDGGLCPKTKQPLLRKEIGGRTTCWSPARQKLPAAKSPVRNPRRLRNRRPASK